MRLPVRVTFRMSREQEARYKSLFPRLHHYSWSGLIREALEDLASRYLLENEKPKPQTSKVGRAKRPTKR